MFNKEAKLNDNIFSRNLDKAATRDGYGDGVVMAGEENEDIVVLTADLTESTRSHKFEEKFPDRFIQVGVAEQNLAGISAGLALEGKIPYMASYASFSPGRNWEQIKIAICYSNANVKIISSHAGLSVGEDGATHQALEDIALTRVLPNIVVVNPSDYEEAKKATFTASKIEGPVYIRLAREKSPKITTKQTDFKIGQAQVFMEGRDVTIFSSGPIIYEAMKAAYNLELNHGISCHVVNVSTIKPLDKKTIIEAAKKTRRVITLEEHQVFGGLGGAIAELLSQEFPVKMELMGIQDTFGESGEPAELWEKYGISSGHIEVKVKNLMHKT